MPAVPGALRLSAALLVSSLLVPCAAAAKGSSTPGSWKQVNPYWRTAYVFSFRSPDLLSNEADERWGREDGRLSCGGILTEFPGWLRMHHDSVEAARDDHRPILLSLHTHGGYGTGIVTYSPDLKHAEVANYPWLIRQLNEAGLNRRDVTVVVDTCNSQAVAAYQLRPDLVTQGPEAFPPFKAWRAAYPERKRLSLASAYKLFEQDRVRRELARASQGSRANVEAAPLELLSKDERSDFRGRLYGQRGVVLATPAFFNILRLGPDRRDPRTPNLLTDRLDTKILPGELAQNNAEFRLFTEYAFLQQAGPGPILSEDQVREMQARASKDDVRRDRVEEDEPGDEERPAERRSDRRDRVVRRRD